MRWKIPIFIIIGLIAIIVIALVYGNAQWQSTTKAIRMKLNAAHIPEKATTYSSAELKNLPELVQRYLRNILNDGQRIILTVNLKQAGTFNMGKSSDQWKSFTADPYIVTKQPGFDWDARITMVSGISVHVHDAYVEGEGILFASLFGLLTMADMHGTPEAADAEFIRYLKGGVSWLLPEDPKTYWRGRMQVTVCQQKTVCTQSDKSYIVTSD